ncbi:hypothetical protein LINPERPRIM_LOCUS3540 [Linum perenne]
MENKQTAAAAADQRLLENRLSTLPDELIHHILARLQSPKQAVKLLTLLSNRWIEIWRSYPIFEIEQDYPYRRTRFSAAVMEKFSQKQGSIAMAAVRVKIHRHADLWPDFLDPVFDLADKFSPPELDITFGKHHGTGYGNFNETGFKITKTFFEKQRFLRHLSVLKLRYCDFDTSPDLGSSLRVLRLSDVSFQKGRILNSMIVSVPQLETLILERICARYLDKFQVRDHPNLKIVEVSFFCMRCFEITGACRLEKVHLTDLVLNDLQVSGTPNLKKVHMKEIWGLRRQHFNKLIAETKSLESVTLINACEIGELKIASKEFLGRLG